MSKQKTDLFNIFSVNKEKANDGVWHEVSGTGMSLRIGRLHNTAHTAKHQRLMEENAIALSLGEGASDSVKEATVELRDELFRKSLAGTVVTDTKNLYYKGEACEFSEALLEDMLAEMEDFYIWVFAIANNATLYRDRFEKDAVKNS